MRFEILDLIGKEITKIEGEKGEGDLILTAKNGDRYIFTHDQDCCEDVTIEDICGDLSDLLDSPLLQAEEVVHKNENPPDVSVPEYQDCFTWTFYKFSTIKGSVTIRWYGSSNGYYSESVDIHLEKAK